MAIPPTPSLCARISTHTITTLRRRSRGSEPGLRRLAGSISTPCQSRAELIAAAHAADAVMGAGAGLDAPREDNNGVAALQESSSPVSVGYDRIDLQAATETRIIVANTA